jgi:hypothetical protein
MVVVAGPKTESRESATSASPKCRGPLSECSASRHLRRHPKRQQGVAPELRLERLPMSIRNGTSSSSNPQPQSTAASGRRRLSEVEEEEVCGWISK